MKLYMYVTYELFSTHAIFKLLKDAELIYAEHVSTDNLKSFF